MTEALGDRNRVRRQPRWARLLVASVADMAAVAKRTAPGFAPRAGAGLALARGLMDQAGTSGHCAGLGHNPKSYAQLEAQPSAMRAHPPHV